MTINFCQYDRYREQLLQEQLTWHKANAKRELEPSEIAAFVAGFNDGWRKLISALKLHDGLRTT